MGCAEFLGRWRKWIRPLVMGVYVILVLVAIPLCIQELNNAGAGVAKQSWFVGGIFVMAAIPISLWGILQHLIHYTKPYLQRHILRILWMVPIYAVNAWFGLRFPSAAIYLDTLRECYEAYVIYNFLTYLLNFLASQRLDYEDAIAAKQQQQHLFPFCKVPPWKMGKELINRCKHGAMQYTVIRPVTTTIALICELTGKYDEGNFSFYSAWPYLMIVNNISQIYAMYCLVLFYKACREELTPLKPISKFLCVKFVIFMSFWQAVAIAVLVDLGVITKEHTWDFEDVESVAKSLQDFCICIEMFVAAIAHFFSFSHLPFVRAADDADGDCCGSFRAMFDMSDMRDDVVDHVRAVGQRVRRPFRRRAAAGDNERAPLLSADADVHSTNSASTAGRIRQLSSGSIGTAASLNADHRSERQVSDSLRSLAGSASVDVQPAQSKCNAAIVQAARDNTLADESEAGVLNVRTDEPGGGVLTVRTDSETRASQREAENLIV